MLRRLTKFVLRLGVLAVIIATVVKVLEDEKETAGLLQPVDAKTEWVEPEGSACPASHPIKAKLSSKVFRGPNSPGYATSKPDRCYVSEDAARSDGLREAKR